MRGDGGTIAAIATAPGRGGIGIVRISGPGCQEIAAALLGRVPAPRSAELHRFLDAAGGADLRSCLPRTFEKGARPVRAFGIIDEVALAEEARGRVAQLGGGKNGLHDKTSFR